MVTWPSGKAKVCKTFIHQFKSGRHLHKPVTKKMSQAFFFAVSSKIGNFANRFLDTVLQCCPTVLGRFSQLDAHFPCRFLEFGRGGDNFFEKNRINPAAFRMFSISPWSVFCRLRGFFAFLTVFSLFSGFPFYTYGQAAGNHVGNECGGLFHPPGGDYHIDTADEDGNPTTTEITETVLAIELTHKTPDEMAADYHFTTRQNA